MGDTTHAFSVAQLDALIGLLRADGLRVIGPVVRDGAVQLDEIVSVADLPKGWGDAQEKGVYRLRRDGHEALFAHNAGPSSWKKYLFPPRRRLFSCDANLQMHPEPLPDTRYAFLGVRACDLAAMRVQDKVFGGHDAAYERLRADALIIAVHCQTSAATCFCASMGTGPEFNDGYDLLLTEFRTDAQAHFSLRPGSARGETLAARLGLTAFDDASRTVVETSMRAQLAAVRDAQVRRLDPDRARSTLMASLQSPHWDDVAERCLACANCTLVCPTCFCSTVEDVTDVTGDHAERWQRWDSCFNAGFTHARGGSFRTNTGARYRQWITHKLATWYDQFGSSGCVGCGRCIAWCPVGIDLVEEVGALTQARSG
jgi:formate hydrogenlyase subunit 6/NADH:ubiquinone oxidoreductase subunit I